MFILNKLCYNLSGKEELILMENKNNSNQPELTIQEQTRVRIEKLDKLKEKGVLNEATTENALSQSNIDAMAVEQVQEETAQDIAAMSDSKIIKLASLAVLIKNFPTEKLKSILQKFNKPERDVLIKYLKMPDLEEKLDANATIKCFEEIKNTLPEAIVISYDRAYKKMCRGAPVCAPG